MANGEDSAHANFGNSPASCLLLAGCGAVAPTRVKRALPSTSRVDAPYEVVAIGASNTEGHGRGRTADGVSREQAYPAQLERLLASQGCRVRVLNAGRAGDTTDGMLARLPGLIGTGTKVVIVQPGGNDERRVAPEARGRIWRPFSKR